MKIISAFKVRDLDLPFIESPFFAVSKVKKLLSNGNVWGLDEIRRDLDFSFMADKERVHRRILERVEQGDLFLLMDSPSGRLFSPLVEWDGRQWRAKSLGCGAYPTESLVESKLPRLNARGLSPSEVASARFPVYAVAPAVAVPERRPEPPPPPSPPAQPSERILHIGVFFDGTGNNMFNDRQLTDRDITNVAKLFDLYRYRGESGDVHPVYIHGIGSIIGEPGEDGFDAPEDIFGLGLGIGEEGGHARIELALKQVRQILEENEEAQVFFDVFGFSRGAALARHFVNLIHRWPETLYVPDFQSGLPLPGQIPIRRIDAFPPGRIPFPQVRFVGLFDTVGSFYLPGNARNYDFKLHLAPGSAQRVAQLTAYHEIRRNFPLSSLADAQGNLPGHFSEIALPGVHSDVGGGYENPEVDFANHEELVVRRRAGLGANGSTVRLAQEEAALRGLDIWVEGMDVVEIERRATRKELAIYALQQMHRRALSAGVPFTELRDNTDYRIPAVLQAALEAWQETGGKLEDARRYLHGYIHTSHRDDSLAHAPEPSVDRRVFANRPATVWDKQREAQDA